MSFMPVLTVNSPLLVLLNCREKEWLFNFLHTARLQPVTDSGCPTPHQLLSFYLAECLSCPQGQYCCDFSNISQATTLLTSMNNPNFPLKGIRPGAITFMAFIRGSSYPHMISPTVLFMNACCFRRVRVVLIKLFTKSGRFSIITAAP